MPQDIDYENESDIEPTSVYQHLGLLKYLNLDDDPRGNILSAIFFAKDKWEVDMDLVLEKAKNEGIDIANISGVGYLGENYNVEIIFVKKDESWFDLGCTSFIKIEDSDIHFHL